MPSAIAPINTTIIASAKEKPFLFIFPKELLIFWPTGEFSELPIPPPPTASGFSRFLLLSFFLLFSIGLVKSNDNLHLINPNYTKFN